MNIGVYFEVGGFNTLTTDHSMIDQYATLAQAENKSHSENAKFGMRRRMESGRTLLNHTQFLGYTKGEDGELKIVPEEAEIVRKIFELYVQGNGVRKIKKYLGEDAHEPIIDQKTFNRVQEMNRCYDKIMLRELTDNCWKGMDDEASRRDFTKF